MKFAIIITLTVLSTLPCWASCSSAGTYLRGEVDVDVDQSTNFDEIEYDLLKRGLQTDKNCGKIRSSCNKDCKEKKGKKRSECKKDCNDEKKMCEKKNKGKKKGRDRGKKKKRRRRKCKGKKCKN